jgi:hypothetical protein
MAAGGSGGELARPETTGYGHSGWEEVDGSGLSSGPREDSRHVNEERLEPHGWGEARSDRHGDPTQSRAPAGRPAKPIVPPPRWPLRTEAGASGWKAAFFGIVPEEKGEKMGARTKTTVAAKAAKAAKDGIPAGHKKIISEVLVREDAKPTGDAVRMAVSNPRREFARYQVPTDRGLKDIEIFDGRVKVRSESTYGFPKVAEDGADGLPDRVAPPDEAEALDEFPAEPPPGDEPDEAVEEAGEEGGLRLHVDIVATPPDGMEEEDVISILDEALLDPDIADAINAKLEGSGVTLRILEVETYEEDDERTPPSDEDEMAEIPLDEGAIDEGTLDEGTIDEDAIEEVAAK